MQDFGLRAAPPIKSLRRILRSYPPGSLLSEALQNAEDSEAAKFTLLLDERQQYDGASDAQCAGPAFVLIDNGRGFRISDWKSIKDLDDSRKARSPRDIGRYGMGSRGYFHYADVMMIQSNGSYVGIDPLNLVRTHGRGHGGGWKHTAEAAAEADEVAAEARDLMFTPRQMVGHPDLGATIRLPLRTVLRTGDSECESDGDEEDEGEGDGEGEGEGESQHHLASRAVSVDEAAALLETWADALDGRVLLFLSSVVEVGVWRWREGADRPELVRCVRKQLVENCACPRLPKQLPDSEKVSYKKLEKYVKKLPKEELEKLSEVHMGLVDVSATLTDGAETTTQWLVAQQFDADKMTQAAAVLSVPAYGVAVPLNSGGGSGRGGGAFCFLPIGDIVTGLPIHVNGCFEVTDNRCNLWLDKAGTLQGEHKRRAEWNDTLRTECLPRLWLQLLPDLSRRVEPASFLVLLPNLAVVQPEWKALADSLYVRLRDALVLPHMRCDGPQAWVAPSTAHVLELPTDAFRAQRAELLRLHQEHWADGDALMLVDLPEHLEAACLAHSGLRRLSIDAFLQQMLTAMAPCVVSLAPALLALAELVDTGKYRSKCMEWADRLAAHAWVPLAQGKHVMPSAAFAPGEPQLVEAGLHVVKQATAEICCEMAQAAAVKRSVIAWGVKIALSWDDALLEAQHIATLGRTEATAKAAIEAAHRLLRHLVHHRPAGLPGSELLRQLSEVRFVPGEKAAPRPPKSEKPEMGEVGLFAMRELLPRSARRVVWAVAATFAAADADALLGELAACEDGKQVTHVGMLTPELLVQQLGALAGLGTSPQIANHLLASCKALEEVVPPPLSGNALRAVLRPLLNLAWLPSLCGNSVLRLLPANQVATDWTFARTNAHGSFGQPLDSWRSLSQTLLPASGVADHFPPKTLLTELRKLGALPGTLVGMQLDYAIELVAHLAARLNELDQRLASATGESVEELRDELAALRDQCIVPTLDGTLQPAPTTYINDAPWAGGTGRLAEGTVFLLHERIPPVSGRLLGCTSVRDELARRCIEVDSVGEDFEQKEELAHRIHQLLRDYNGPADLLKEHWQNSDDADADAVLFCLDTTSYPTQSLVSERASSLQGPALLLASSRALSADDIRHMQRLGDSDKRAAFDKTGQFGVGLNCMYHLSDAWLLLANNTLHLFDPLFMVAQGRTGGARWSRQMLEQNAFSDMLAPFVALDPAHWPTIFRLPLRTSPSELSKNVCSPTEIERLLCTEFVASARQSIVFSRCVRTVELATCSSALSAANGASRSVASGAKWRQIARFEVGEVTSVHRFLQQLPASLEEVQALCGAPRAEVAMIEVSEQIGDFTLSRARWLVAHALECDATLSCYIASEYEPPRGIARLPHGAAALRLDAPNDFGGHFCCTFPIGVLTCGPPLLLHGRFSLSSDRHSIKIAGQRAMAQRDPPFGASAASPCRGGGASFGGGGGGASFGGGGAAGFGSGAAQNGTGSPPYRDTQELDGHTYYYKSITQMAEYQKKSFEELRWEDYAKCNKGTGTEPQLDWNCAVLEGPVAAALASLLREAKSLVVAGELDLATYFAVLDMPNKSTNAGSEQLRTIVRGALMRRLLAPAAFEAFPILVHDVHAPIIFGFRGPSFDFNDRLVLRTGSLCRDTQDELVRAGLRIVSLPESVQNTLMQTSTDLGLRSPRHLDPETLCEFLRTYDPLERKESAAAAAPSGEEAATGQREPDMPLSEPDMVRSLLRFVVTESRREARARGDSLLDLSMLQQVPLLLLQNGKLAKFDSTSGAECSICCLPVALNSERRLGCNHVFHDECVTVWLRIQPSCPNCRAPATATAPASSYGAACLFDWHDLLPCAPEQFIDKEQQAILLGAADSRQVVERAASLLGVRPLRLADLLPHREALHTSLAPLDRAWRESFWALVWQHKDDFTDWHQAFGDWHVVQTLQPGGDATEEGVCTIDQLPLLFSLHRTDQSKQKAILRLLGALGCHALHPNHVADENQLDLLEPLVHWGDKGLCTLLAARRDAWDALHGAERAQLAMILLQHFASRTDTEPLTQDEKSTLRSLPLFLRADVGRAVGASRYVRIDRGVTCLCLQLDQGCTDRTLLMELIELRDVINSNLTFVATEGLTPAVIHLYGALGVQSMFASEFVTKHVCPALPTAAARPEWLVPMLQLLEKWSAREEIRNAAAEQKFVQAAAGGTFKASELEDPDQPLACEFAKELQECFPAASYKPHLKLLRDLGLRKLPSLRFVARCAKILAQSADMPQISEAVERKSCMVVNEVCMRLAAVWNQKDKEKGDREKRRSEASSRLHETEEQHRTRLEQEEKQRRCEQMLLSAARLPIALGHEPEPTSQRVARTARVIEAAAAVAERPPLPLHLKPLQRMLLSPTAEQLAWTQMPSLALGVFSRRGLKCQGLEQLASHPAALKEALSCACGWEGLDLETMLLHLLAVMRALASENIDWFSPLCKALHELYLAINAKLCRVAPAAPTPFAASNDCPLSDTEASLFVELSKLPCVAWRELRDASGSLCGSRVLMCEPARIFFSMPKHCELQHYLREELEGGAIFHLKVLAKKLGIREEPQLADWVRCLRAVAEVHAESEGPLLANDSNAAKVALTQIGHMLRDGKTSRPTAPLQLFLFAEVDDASADSLPGEPSTSIAQPLLLPASQLVWLDQPALKHRCGALRRELGLRFVGPEPLGWFEHQRADLEILAEWSELRGISEVLTEHLTPPEAIDEVGEEEQKLAALLFSPELVAGLGACAGQSRSQESLQVLQQSLQPQTLSVLWMDAPIRSVLQHKGVMLEGSEKELFAFAEPGNNVRKLWLCAGMLQTSERDLLRELSEALLKLLPAGAGPFELGMVEVMLSCWSDGPDKIVPELNKRGIAINGPRRRTEPQPGEPVPESQLDFVQHDIDNSFHVGELVVVLPSSDDHTNHEQSFKFAKVLPRDGRDSGPARGSEDLLRVYSLDEGGGRTERTHLELYKFGRVKPQEAVGSSLVPHVGAAPASAVADPGLAQLKAQLRQMENMSLGQYKRAAYRLWKQWHPDRCANALATQASQLLSRHIEAYHDNKDFRFLDELDPEAQSEVPEREASAGAPRPAAAAAVPHSWFEEFASEDRGISARAQRVRQQHEQQQRLWRDAAPKRPQRRVDARHADLLWSQSAAEEASAHVLAEGARHAHAVWHAQQACELALKSLMMRTCGVLEEELRGKDAHDLLRFVDRVDRGSRCPVPRDELQVLTHAYLQARYPDAAAAQLPVDRYTVAHAQMALRSAEQLRLWLSSLDAVTTPRKPIAAAPQPGLTPRTVSARRRPHQAAPALSPAPAAGLFGAFSAPASAPAAGLFGGAPAPAPAAAPAAGLFGGAPAPAPAAAPAAGLFGGAPAPAPAAGLFGAPAPSPAAGLFGTPAPAPAAGLFGTPAPAPAAGLFGTPAPVPETSQGVVGFSVSPSGTTGSNVAGSSPSVFAAPPSSTAPMTSQGEGGFIPPPGT